MTEQEQSDLMTTLELYGDRFWGDEIDGNTHWIIPEMLKILQSQGYDLKLIYPKG